MKRTVIQMSKKLVAYFSATGITARIAENFADSIGADLFAIIYTYNRLHKRRLGLDGQKFQK